MHEQVFLQRSFAIEDVRCRLLEIGPCGDPACECAKRPDGTFPVYAFAKPDPEHDEWSYVCTEDDLEGCERAAREILGDPEGARRIAMVAAVTGVEWEKVSDVPAHVGHVQAAFIVDQLTDSERAFLLALGAEQIREWRANLTGGESR